MRRSRLLIGALTALGVALPLSNAAYAEAPGITRWGFDNYDSPDVFTDECAPGAHLVGVYEIHGSDTLFFDSEDTLIRVVVLVHFDARFTRTDTGNSIKHSKRERIEIDLVAGEQTVTGFDSNIIDPGDGPIFQIVGRKVESFTDGAVFDAGPNDFADGRLSLVEVCKALA